MRRPVLAVLVCCVLLLATLCCFPEFREALTVERALLANIFQSQQRVHDRRLQRMLRIAEVRHDAQLLAWTALQMDGQEAISNVQKAVSWDAGLQWIYAVACGKFSAATDSRCDAMISNLIAAEPANSVPYLTQASRILRMKDPEGRNPSVVLDDPAWRASVMNALNAERYDNYFERSTALRKAIGTRSFLSTTEYAEGLTYMYWFPAFQGLTPFVSHLTTADAPKLFAFAERVKVNARWPVEDTVAESWINSANRLQPRFDSAGLSPRNQARLFSEADAVWSSMPLVEMTSLLFHLGVLCQCLAALSLTGALITGFVVGKRRPLGTGWDLVVCLSAGMLGFTSVLVFLLYHPYAKILRSLWSSGGSPFPSWLYLMLSESIELDSSGALLWTLVLIACAVSLAAVLTKAALDKWGRRAYAA